MHAPVSGCGSPCKPQDVARGVAYFHASWCGSLSCLMVWLTSMPHGVAHHACWKMWLTVCSSWCGSLCIPHGVAHFHASRCVSLHIPQDVTCCACCPRCGSPCMPHDVAHCACLMMWLTVHASRCGSLCMPHDVAHCACLMMWLTVHASWCGSPCMPQDVAHCACLMMWLTVHASWCGSLCMPHDVAHCACLKMWLTVHASWCGSLCMPHDVAHCACLMMWLTVHASRCGSLCMPHDVAHCACLKMWLTVHASWCGSLCMPHDVAHCACLMMWLTVHASWCGSPCVPHDVAHCACLMMWLTVHASWCGSPCMPQDMAHCACLMSLAVAAFEISLAEWVHFSISMGGLVCSRLHGLIQVSLHRARQLGHSPILCAGHYPGGHALQTESTCLSAQTVWGFFGSRRQQESRQVVHKLIDDKSWQREREQSKRREQVDLWLFKDWIQVGWFVFQWYACGCVWD